MVGCADGTGRNERVDAEKDEAWGANTLQAPFRLMQGRNKASLIVLKRFRATYRSELGTRFYKLSRIPRCR